MSQFCNIDRSLILIELAMPTLGSVHLKQDRLKYWGDSNKLGFNHNKFQQICSLLQLNRFNKDLVLIKICL